MDGWDVEMGRNIQTGTEKLQGDMNNTEINRDTIYNYCSCRVEYYFERTHTDCNR